MWRLIPFMVLLPNVPYSLVLALYYLNFIGLKPYYLFLFPTGFLLLIKIDYCITLYCNRVNLIPWQLNNQSCYIYSVTKMLPVKHQVIGSSHYGGSRDACKQLQCQQLIHCGHILFVIGSKKF